MPVPHSEEIRRCILLFLCTLGSTINLSEVMNLRKLAQARPTMPCIPLVTFKRIALRLASTWPMPYSAIMGWLRCRVSSHSCALLLCVFADRVSMCAEDSVARCWQSPQANFNPTSSNCASSNNKTLSLLLLSRLYSFLLTIFQEAMFILKF